jgi:hypothetical protein
MGTFQIADAPIIRPGWVGLYDAGEHTAGVQQVRYRPKRCRCGDFRLRGGIQVGPGRWDERPRAVRQNQNEIQRAVASHPAQQRQRLTFQRVAGSDDRDCGRVPLEVGSVLPFRSILFRTSSCCERSDDTPMRSGSCCTWSAG